MPSGLIRKIGSSAPMSNSGFSTAAVRYTQPSLAHSAAGTSYENGEPGDDADSLPLPPCFRRVCSGGSARLSAMLAAFNAMSTAISRNSARQLPRYPSR